MNEIIVGNVGTVYSGSDDELAAAKYKIYVESSKSGRGRAGGEDVVWMRDGDVFKSFTGELNS